MYDYVLQYGFDIESEKNIQTIKNYLKDNNIKDKERKWRPHITIDLYDLTHNVFESFVAKVKYIWIYNQKMELIKEYKLKN